MYVWPSLSSSQPADMMERVACKTTGVTTFFLIVDLCMLPNQNSATYSCSCHHAMIIVNYLASRPARGISRNLTKRVLFINFPHFN